MINFKRVFNFFIPILTSSKAQNVESNAVGKQVFENLFYSAFASAQLPYWKVRKKRGRRNVFISPLLSHILLKDQQTFCIELQSLESNVMTAFNFSMIEKWNLPLHSFDSSLQNVQFWMKLISPFTKLWVCQHESTFCGLWLWFIQI